MRQRVEEPTACGAGERLEVPSPRALDSDLVDEARLAVDGKPVGELYPHPDLLAACRERGVPVTTGSDAHSPDVVGRDFDRARELLRSAGYETVTVFERRQRRQEPLG